MKVNIFSIPTKHMAALEGKLARVGMEVINEGEQDGWKRRFFYSTSPEPTDIPWVETYRSYFEDSDLPQATNYFAVHMFEKEGACYALSYGKSHFYLRPFCDYDFGIELAKRIANESEIRQTASKRFQGKKKKDIKSFGANTRLDIESGESVDYLYAAVIDPHRDTFGKSGKFGTSAQLNPEIELAGLGRFLSEVATVIGEDARFPLPRTTVITEEAEAARFDNMLVDAVLAPLGETDFTHNSFDLYGIDFVFSTEGTYTLTCGRHPGRELEELTMPELNRYVADCGVTRDEILKIRVTYTDGNRPKYSQSLKQAVDFIADDDNVLLTNGRWMRFNQDYLQFLNDYLAAITIEEVEAEFQQISQTEGDFNASPEIADAQYELADKNFDIFRARSSTPIEAWDLKRDNRVYAVKFGPAQKLGYVCDQAFAVLELMRNRAGVKKIPDFNEYCLWLGYEAKAKLPDITKSGSIILKQKIETWARKTRELGIEPVLKISQKL